MMQCGQEQVQSFTSKGIAAGPGGQYSSSGNPTCGVQSICTYTKDTTSTPNPTIPNLTKNKCCNPYLDKDSFIVEGKDWIFNSYYGACYSGYNWNYDWCSNKQIWIQAAVDEIGSTIYGDYGLPAIEISHGLNISSVTGQPETLIQNSRNTKDRVFMGGKGNLGGNASDWDCLGARGSNKGPSCQFPINTETMKYAPHNLPQKSLNGSWRTQFPYVEWSDTKYWSAANLSSCSQTAPNGCPNTCPDPQGWQRWGAKYLGSGTPPDCKTWSRDPESDWTPALPGDGLGSIGVFMPRGYNYNLQYSPSIKVTNFW